MRRSIAEEREEVGEGTIRSFHPAFVRAAEENDAKVLVAWDWSSVRSRRRGFP